MHVVWLCNCLPVCLSASRTRGFTRRRSCFRLETSQPVPCVSVLVLCFGFARLCWLVSTPSRLACNSRQVSPFHYCIWARYCTLLFLRSPAARMGTKRTRPSVISSPHYVIPSPTPTCLGGVLPIALIHSATARWPLDAAVLRTSRAREEKRKPARGEGEWQGREIGDGAAVEGKGLESGCARQAFFLAPRQFTLPAASLFLWRCTLLLVSNL